MKITKSQLRKIIREEYSKVVKENENPHAGKSVDEIAQWYLNKWENMRMQFSSIPPEIMPPERIDLMLATAVEDTVDQIMNDPEIRQDYYPHLSDEEINDLVAQLGGPAAGSSEERDYYADESTYDTGY